MDEPSSGPIENDSAPVPASAQPEGKSKKESWLTLPLAIVMAGVFISAAILATRSVVPASDAAAAAGSGTITADTLRPASSSDHILGNPNAPVVIVEFADFQCPYCSLIYPTIKKIVADSGGQVAWVFRNFPLESIHPMARPAAEAAECIGGELGNDAYWKFMEDDFDNQKDLSDAWIVAEAAKLGANMAEFNQCVTKKTYDDRINTDLTEAIQNGGDGTPFTIVVPKTGRAIPFSGALPYSQVSAIVATALTRAGVATSTAK